MAEQEQKQEQHLHLSMVDGPPILAPTGTGMIASAVVVEERRRACVWWAERGRELARGKADGGGSHSQF